MSELESFSSYESSNQGSDPESFRLFQERMKVAAAQIKDIKVGEQKQKKKEDKLIRILGDFIKSKQGGKENDEFLTIISSLLALNIPAVFILSILILNFPELQKESGIKLLTFDEAMKAGGIDSETIPDIYLGKDKLPLGVKVALDSWIQEISNSGIAERDKIIKNGINKANRWHSDILEFVNFGLLHYLRDNNLEMDHTIIRKFSELFMHDILIRLIKERQELEEPDNL